MSRLESVQTQIGKCSNACISSPSLKRIEFCGYGGDYQIVLNAPVLEYIEVSDCVAGGYLVKDLKSLATARLSVGLTENQKGGDSLRYGSYVTNLVNVISGSIKFLCLSGQTLEAIDYSNCSLPAFCNLTPLELDVNFLHGWKLLPNLLQSAPNLEVLDFIQRGKYREEEKQSKHNMETEISGSSSPISCEVLDIDGNYARDDCKSHHKLEFKDDDDFFNTDVPIEAEGEQDVLHIRCNNLYKFSSLPDSQ
ncbi:hypothetical protein RHSIM_Rhsim07G0064000 [Rhododendron simsii]|uniref:Uncharacterized protein n=1 Tax=Rhododendron simsii TaxID=118357 RepID=A0A834LLP3_RHOSS|nr:hypothetical protein RHSIM_Rhsim07G0064000 [Rhododendron simsii]